MSKIISIATLSPGQVYSTEEIISAAKEKWLCHKTPQIQNRAIKLLNGSKIKSRSAVVDLATIFSPLSFEEKNNIYRKEIIPYAAKVLTLALDQAQLLARDIDFIISVSCTGFMIPSVDAYLMNQFNFPQHTLRLPVTEIGCAGGTSGLIYASHFLKSCPDKRVALLTLEFPSLTLQLDDMTAENLVSMALFSDGVTCTIIEGDQASSKNSNSKTKSQALPVIKDTEMYHFPHSNHFMGYNLTNSGFKIILDKCVPSNIEEHIPHILNPFFKKNQLDINEVAHFILHPGGKKIVSSLEKFLAPYGKSIEESKSVLENLGNMSSSTVIFILEKYFKREISRNEFAFMMAFGPGFSANSILLKWE